MLSIWQGIRKSLERKAFHLLGKWVKLCQVLAMQRLICPPLDPVSPAPFGLFGVLLSLPPSISGSAFLLYTSVSVSA